MNSSIGRKQFNFTLPDRGSVRHLATPNSPANLDHKARSFRTAFSPIPGNRTRVAPFLGDPRHFGNALVAFLAAFAHRDLHLRGAARRGAAIYEYPDKKALPLRVLVADVDDACAAAAVIGASDRCEKAPARPHTRLRKDGGREERSALWREGRRGRVQWEARIRVIVSG